MPIFETLSLILVAAIAWLWFDSMQVRNVAAGMARDACLAEGVQLLDDTVSIARLDLARNDDGQVCLRRVYAFEFSETGDNRRRGSVTLLGHEVLLVNLGLRLTTTGGTLH